MKSGSGLINFIAWAALFFNYFQSLSTFNV